MTLVLDTLWSDEALNLRCFGVRLGSFFLWDDFSSNDELANIILLVKAEELANLGSTLGTETLWVDDISQAWNILVTLFDDREGEDGEVLCDNAATD